MTNVKINAELELAGSLSFNNNLTEFPSVAKPNTIVVKDGILYMYGEIINGSGFFSWQPVGIKQASYLHVQSVPNTRWIIKHNFNSTDFGYFVYDTEHNLILVNNTIIDANSIQLDFSIPTAGTAVLFSLQYLNSATVTTQQFNLSQLNLTAGSGILLANGDEIVSRSYVDSINSQLNAKLDTAIANSNPSMTDVFNNIVSEINAADSVLSDLILTNGSTISLAISAETTRAEIAESSVTDSMTELSTNSIVKVNSNSLSTVAISGLHSDLSNIPLGITQLSGFINDTDFSTSYELSVNVNTERTRSIAAESNLSNTLSTERNRASGIETALALRLNAYDGGSSGLAVIAKSGHYSDLINAPLVPTKTSEMDNDVPFSTSTELANLLTPIDSGIANKATLSNSLSGYGIKDAYTKTEFNAAVSSKAMAGHNLHDYEINNALSIYRLGEPSSIDNTIIGAATLDGTGKIPTSNLPSFIDDVIEVVDYAHLPSLGYAKTGKIYVTKDNNFIYRWNGSTYVELSNEIVDFTPKLHTARKISLGNKASGSVTFDGTSNVTLNVNLQSTIDAVNTKADAATTLSGYGITNGITVNKLATNSGVATLNEFGVIYDEQLPTSVNDIIESVDFASLPVSGNSGIIYVTLDENKIYRWSGTEYIEMSPGDVASTMQHLTTARTIALSGSLNGLTVFDGSENVIIDVTLPDYYIKSDADGLISAKAIANDVYTQLQIDTKLAKKADAKTTFDGYGITDAVNINKLNAAMGVASLTSDGVIGYAHLPNNVATLSDGKVPNSQLPDFTDDVLEFADITEFPSIGVSGVIYTTLNDNRIYRWSGSTYIEVSSAGVGDAANQLVEHEIMLSGSMSGTTQFDGTSDVSIAVNLPNVYSNSYIDIELDKKVNTGTLLSGYGINDAYTTDTVYNKLELTNLLKTKATKSETLAGYTIGNAYTKSVMYIKSQVDSVFSNKVNKSTTLAGYGITDAAKSSQVGVATVGNIKGISTLDSSGIVPLSQLPLIPTHSSDFINDIGYQTSTDVANAISASRDQMITFASDLITIRDTMLANQSILDEAVSHINDKVDKHTTLAGYTIGDSYTKSETYSKTESNNKLNAKVNSADVYIKTDVDNLISTKIDTKHTLGEYGITDAVSINSESIVHLDVMGKVSENKLPSYVNDVVEFTNYAARPMSGESGVLYVDLSTNRVYRWSGSDYFEVSSAGISDTALKIVTPRTIALSGKLTGSVSFDGTTNIDISALISDVYNKTEVNSAFTNKVNIGNTTLSGYGITDSYTTTEINTLVNTFADKATSLAGYGITDAGTPVDFNTTQTVSNKTFDMAKIGTVIEKVNIIASAPSSTTNLDIKSNAAWYYTSTSTSNFTLNLRGSSSVTFDSCLLIGDNINVTLMVTNGSTAYKPNSLSIDGVAMTTKWIGGLNPTGNANSIDLYTYTVYKTAANTFTVMAMLSKFA
jgi:hypothetical protein